MNNNPLVSVIIPTYNRANKLRTAIDSVLRQSYTPIQLIVIDDGSEDETAALMEDYKEAQYIIQQHKGQAAARNNGLKHAEGSIVASLDSDDIWNPDFLERCVHKLEKDKLDFVFANWTQDARVGEAWDFLSGDPFLKPHIKETEDHWITLTYPEVRGIYIEACPSPSSSVVIRKSSIVSGWDERINIGDDWCMYLDVILSKECRVAFTLDKLWRKRIDNINIYDGRKRSEVLKYLYIADTLLIMEKFDKLLTPGELLLLQKRYIASLVELAKHELIREYNLKESYRLIKKSMAVNIPFTLKMIPDILMTGLSRKYKGIKEKRMEQPA
ncbi:glycosyltransferase involved in cell wall biosynthesis [Pedobacter cryoconitis]|uniref:glycosyltransferase family 2 protein n=1 Tax=Pedobacter cryoconitis TaxID=188932 RepID=UPI001619393C|nr:glycosyltransferase family A protein [Pedobacter cryoconitis]MBB6269804.1 glycosyltransferase involved in cell wall biosynthesis [Pedobacter cryoconitis]